MKKKNNYDVVVLGGGPGGYTAAFRAADLGLSVCLVEQRKRLGGVCLQEGCIPSKTLLHGTSFIEQANDAEDYGISFSRPVVDIDRLRQKKDAVINQLASGLDTLCLARNITRIAARGHFDSASTLRVVNENGASCLHFTDAVIATGSSPFTLPGQPDDPRIWDSSDALSLQTIPEKLLIIGGGIIGMEMAQVYQALGTEITIVEMLGHIIPPADRDLISPLVRRVKKRYTIYTRTRVTSLQSGQAGITACFNGARVPASATFDAVLVAVGRRPNTKEMGFAGMNLQLNERGAIVVNARQQSSVPHVYAVGDVVGEPMLAHKAIHQARVAAENIAGIDSIFSPLNIPSVAYTEPEIAWTGLTETEAKAQKTAYNKGKFPWGASGRALSAGASAGQTKVLFDKTSGRILGAGICGRHAGELIHEAVLALERGATAAQIDRTVHAHPTLAETFAFAAELVNGTITDALPAKK